MVEIIEEESAEFEAFLASHPKGHFLQSARWGKVKSAWTWKAVAVRGDEGEIKGGCAVLIRRMPMVPYTLMYAGRGPVCDPHDRETLSELTDGLRQLAARYKSYALKMDPDIKSDDLEFIQNMESLGYKRRFSKNFEGVQPNYVFRLDLRGKSEEDILAAFHSKTRYNLRLSVRKGVEVRVCGKEMLDHFSRLMNETGTRDGFIVRPREYFEAILDSMGEDARLYMAFWQGTPIAGTIAIHFGSKVWYLYGASSNQYRNVMPNYQLQWEMIRWALETNCDIYDFRGVSGDLTPDNPLYGLYLFKKGFSGEFTEFCGEFEMVYKPAVDILLNKGVAAARSVRHSVSVARSRREAPKEEIRRAPVQAPRGETKDGDAGQTRNS